MGRLSGKVAIITGAAGGQGAAEARLFAKEGAKVVATDMNYELLIETVKSINNEVGSEVVIALEQDVSKEEDWKKVVPETVKQFNKLDVLVNNAGIFSGKSLLEATLDDWNKVIAVNATSVFLGMKYAAIEMKKNGKGSIINISSIAGIISGPSADGLDAPYSASKGAVRSITKNAAHLLAKDNIRVNSVHPGSIRTPMEEKYFADNPEMWNVAKDFSPLPPHMGEPEHAAYGVLYLASDESAFTTGSELVIDGGGISH